MKIQNDDNFSWFLTLDDVKPKYTPIKCWSVLQFYQLIGKRTILSKENLIPIPNLKFVLLSHAENKYYLREYHGWSVDELFFYEQTIDFSKDDIAVESLRRYVDDRRIWLILTSDQVADISNMLTRLYKANLSGEGKLNYRLYLQIFEESLKLEDYQAQHKNDIGFKTNCKIKQDRLNELWRKQAKIP